MQRIGHRVWRLIAARAAPADGPVAPRSAAGIEAAWLALGALAAVVPALRMRGFTVDDALISVRYARHLATGLGWRFDAAGPSTDGVTPLPWPVVLAPMARGSALAVLGQAQALGLLAWGVAGAALGRSVGRVSGAPVWARVAALGILALSVPVAAHAVSGMETALATALATGAALMSGRPRAAAVLAGLAASLRPELAPWAVVLATGFSLARAEGAARALLNGALAMVPFAVCSVVRAAAWGRPLPLALLAKPSDLAHGLAYAGAACVVTLVPILVLARRLSRWPIRRAPHSLAIAVAGAAHVGALIAVGGDWMPYARLMVPVVPSLVYASVLADTCARSWAIAARSLLVAALGVVLLVRDGASGAQVGADRAALIARAQPVLAGARRVAALDIGWVSAATEADIVDLAGVTDPAIAALPGGHTSKRVDGTLLVSLEPELLLLYAPEGLGPGGLEAWQDASYPRAVERHLAHDATVAHRFEPVAWLPLSKSGAGYVVLRARNPESSRRPAE